MWESLPLTCLPHPPPLILSDQCKAPTQSGRGVTCHTPPFFPSRVPASGPSPLFHYHQTCTVQSMWQWTPCLKCPSFAVSIPRCCRHAERAAWAVHGNPNLNCTVPFFPLKCSENSSLSTSRTHFLIAPTPRKGTLRPGNIGSYKRALTMVTTYPRFSGKVCSLSSPRVLIFGLENTITNQQGSRERHVSDGTPLK